MKIIFIALLSFFSLLASAQINPTNGTVSNKSYSPAQAVSTDFRSWFYDGTNFIMRDYNGTSEVISYLNIGKYRSGHFPIYVHSGGSLGSNGVWTGGVTLVYFFKDGIADGNLVRWYTDSTVVTPKVDTMYRKNDSVIGFTINQGPERTILIRGTAAGGISSLSMAAPGALFGTPVTFTNGGGGAWTGTLSLINQNPNAVFAGPSTGSPGAATFRALVTADLPTGIPNGNLQNSSISFTAIGSSGTSPNWISSPVSLGGNATLNLPITSGSNTGIVNPTQFNFWSGKVDSTVMSNDSVYEWRNGTRFFRYKIIGGGGGGITSLNGLTGATQTFAPGTSGTDFGISSVGTTHTFNIPTASASNRGLLSTGDWTTFNSKINLTSLSATSPLFYNNTTGVFTIQLANTSQNGYLSSADWNTFNGKQAALSGTGYLNFTGTTPSYLTPTQVTANLNLATSVLQGLVPASGGGSTNFLRSDFTWAAPPSGFADPLTTNGDIIARISGSTTRLAQGSNNTFLGVQGGTLGYYAPFSLTTTGSSGAATFSAGVLNIPQYAGGGGGITTLNTLTATTQTFATGTSGTDFNISSVTSTHTFNLPIASATNTGKLSNTDWTVFNNKQSTLRVGPSPYLVKPAVDSLYWNIDSAAYYLGMSSKKYGTNWQYSYDNFWTATTSNGFQVTVVTAGVSGNKITLTGTGNNYLQKYQKTRISYFEHWIMEDTIVLTSAPAATTSIGIGIDNIANLGRVDLTNTGTAGKAYIVTGTTDKATSSGNITFAQNDTIVLKFQQMRDTLTVTATNKANATTATAQLLLPNALQVGNTDSIHVAGQFSIFVKGGSYTLVSQRISILEPQGTPVALFGDSKYEGGYVTTWNARTADRLRALGFNVVQLGSSGSSLSDLYTRLQDVVSLYPSQVILQGYSNDIRQGLSVAQTAINYENLKDLLESYGYKVWVLTAPETGSLASQMRLFDSTVRQRYPQEYIPVYDAMTACGSPCITVDGIHWTDRGNDTVTKYTAKYINNPLYNNDKPIDQVLRTEFAKTKNNVAVVGGNLSYLATSGNFVLGHNTTSPLILKAKGRTTTFGYATNTPWIRFTSESGASSGDIISDSLGNTGMGINAFLTTPTGQNNVLFGRAVSALANASNNRVTAVGSFANNGGGVISAYDVSNSTFFGFEAGYYENTPNKGYIANSRSSNLFYNDYTARKLVVFPTQTGTTPPVFLTTDQFQVNGSSYFLDTVRFGKVPDATLSTDSIALVSNNGSGNFRTLKKAAIGSGLSLAAGVLSATGSGGISRIAPLDSLAKDAKGIQISGISLVPQTADASFPGLVSIGAQTFAGLKTMVAPKFTGLTSAGASDSVLTVDPATNQVHWRNGVSIINFGNGLMANGVDSVKLGSALVQNTTIPGGGFNLSLGTSGSNLGVLDFYSPIINLRGSQSFYGGNPTNANLTVADEGMLYLLPTITANRTITLPSVSNYVCRLLVFTNTNSANFTWSFASTVINPDGSTVTGLTNGYTYILQSHGTFGWIVVSRTASSTSGVKNYEHTIFTPTTGGTVNTINNQYNIINPAGALATLTVNLPSSPKNNDVVYVKYTQTVSAVTYANGTVVDGITAPVAGGLVVLTYDSGTTSWY